MALPSHRKQTPTTLHKYDTLCLDINYAPIERIKLVKGDDVKRIAEGLKTAYNLHRGCYYEIYLYKQSEMNKPVLETV